MKSSSAAPARRSPPSSRSTIALLATARSAPSARPSRASTSTWCVAAARITAPTGVLPSTPPSPAPASHKTSRSIAKYKTGSKVHRPCCARRNSEQRKLPSAMDGNFLCSLSSTQQWCELTLGVLRGLAGALEARLFAFLHARVAREEAGTAQRGLPFGIDAHEGAGQGVANGAGLPADAAAQHFDIHVVDVVQLKRAQGRVDGRQQSLALSKVGLRLLAVHGHVALAVGIEAHAGYRRLAPPHPVVVLTFVCIGHGRSPLPSLFCRRFSRLLLLLLCLCLGLLLLFEQRLRTRPGDGLLRLVRVIWPGIDFQTGHDARAQTVVHHHAAHRVFDGALWMLAFEYLAQCLLLQAAGVLAVTVVDLLIQPVARDGDLFCVNHDHKVTALQVRRKRWFVFAAQNLRDL